MLGRTSPRLVTPPLVELTPETSYGYDVIRFAEAIGMPLDPWQQECAIRIGELLPDGRPRFRTVLLIVARQNGKTTLCKILILFWLFVDGQREVLGTSTDRSYAKATWSEVIGMARDNELLSRFMGPRSVRLTLGEESMTTTEGCTYKFAANNDSAGRSRSLDRWLCDELRQHKDYSCWSSATGAMKARPAGQIVAITNQGDAKAAVLQAQRDAALRYIDTGEGDYRLGLIEYSCPPGSDPTSPEDLSWANPNLNRVGADGQLRMHEDDLVGEGMTAVATGGEMLAKYKTEIMCQRVHQLDPAVDEEAWRAAATPAPIDLAEHRRRVALCVDVALSGQHATLVAAAVVDGIVHTEVVEAWHGPDARADCRRALPALVEKLRPATVGWFPDGPAAALAATLRSRTGSKSWAPRWTKVSELTADKSAVCMGFAEIVDAGQLRHPGDELQTAHVMSAQRLKRGDTWVMNRGGDYPIDAAYATAGAVHLARTLPERPDFSVVALDGSEL